MGAPGITWEIAGVFQANDEEDACLHAAQQTGEATCFAVAGYAWGVDTAPPPDVREFGARNDTDRKMAQLDAMEERMVRALERAADSPTRQLPAGSDD